MAALGAALLLSIYASRGSQAIAAGLLAVFAVGLLAARGVFVRPRPQAVVRVYDEEVVVAHAPRTGNAPAPQHIARASIAAGFFRPAGSGGYVVLRDRAGKDLLEVIVRDEAQAVALLEALELDAAKRLLAIDTASPVTALTGRVGGAVLALAGLGALGAASLFAGISPMFALAVMTLATLVGAWPARVEIAPDGVAITWLTRFRFVRFADVSTVTRTARGATLLLTSGERLLIPRAVGEPGTDAMIARVQEALDVHRTAGKGAAPDTLALLARGDRDVRSWLEHLRGLRGEGYRTSATRDDDLWRVIENPSAGADARAGAALLMRPRLDDAGRARIRVASETTASPKLRVALDAAATADAEDEAVEEHLEELALEE